MLRERLYVVGKGVPWTEAWEMPAEEVIAIMVVFADIDGVKFDWKARKFLAPEA